MKKRLKADRWRSEGRSHPLRRGSATRPAGPPALGHTTRPTASKVRPELRRIYCTANRIPEQVSNNLPAIMIPPVRDRVLCPCTCTGPQNLLLLKRGAGAGQRRKSVTRASPMLSRPATRSYSTVRVHHLFHNDANRLRFERSLAALHKCWQARGTSCPRSCGAASTIQQQWTHWDLNAGPSACGADVIPLHHEPLRPML